MKAAFLSSLYGAAAMWRRQWYSRDPSRRHTLQQPVVSVGNLRVGGSGKTPIVAAIARLLVARGERPSILSRGYGRRVVLDGVTVVSNGQSILAGVDSAGDEPTLLARALPSVAVLVGANRYLSGRLAEQQLGVTVHLLDDGFQHFELARDVDLLATSEEDLSETLLPAGQLREPLALAALADAALVTAGYGEAAARVGRALKVPTAFLVSRGIGVPYMIATHETVVVPADEPVFAVAGIARPERFFGDIESAGWRLVGTRTFADHHPFTDRDVMKVAVAARAAGATIVMTTEKDAVRFRPDRLEDVPLAAVPLEVSIEPTREFEEWLMARLAAARARRATPGTLHPALLHPAPLHSASQHPPSGPLHPAPSREPVR